MGMQALEELTIERIIEEMAKQLYVADREIATALYLAIRLEKPLLIEGEPGCGKTEIAKVLSDMLDTELIRLQCYEGLDVSSTIYEWNYPKQLLYIKMMEGKKNPEEMEEEIFSEKFLLKRPLLKALLHDGPMPAVLLIDEIDRADEEFEGFLLEFLAEFQVTIPEIGTIKARKKPIVIITSNRTREIGEGLRRRCLYLYLTYPPREKELRIVKLKVSGISDRLAREVVEFVQRLRKEPDIFKKPGISETLDWAFALKALGIEELTPEVVKETLSVLLKSSDDIRNVDVEAILAEVKGYGGDGGDSQAGG